MTTFNPLHESSIKYKCNQLLLQDNSAFPFHLQFPSNSPTSVTLQPAVEEAGEPCGVEYYVRGVMEDVSREKTSVNMSIRKMQFAPTKQGRQPSTTVRKDFLFSEGELELESTLDKQLYHHGDDIKCSFVIRNTSLKTVKKISVSVIQNVDIAMFSGGPASPKILQIETTEGCPVGPGSTVHKELLLQVTCTVLYCTVLYCTVLYCTVLKELLLQVTARGLRRSGVAMDGRLKGDDACLASSTLLANENDKNIFGLVISYSVRVKLFLGALGGDLVAELPFVLMHPRYLEPQLSVTGSIK